MQLDDRPGLPQAFVPMPTATAGTFEPNSTTYGSIVEFIDERRQRLYSLVQLGTPDQGGGHVELVAAGLEIEELEEAVSGWREAQDNGDESLDWLRSRVRRLTAREGAMTAG